MHTLAGADADALDHAALALRAAAADLDARADGLTAEVRSVAWVGGVAERFEANWRRTHRPRIRATVDAVRAAAERLERHAAEQRAASRASPLPSRIESQTGGWSGAIPGDGAEHRLLGGLQALLDGLDAGRDVVESVIATVDRLGPSDGFEHLADFVDVLTDEAVRNLLIGADVVLDAGSVVVDLVADFVEHTTLSFDERLVHALADTAARFGVEQGMETAAQWLAGAATAALVPAFGAVLAPLAGEIAGVVAGEIVDAAIDAVDGATDVVDTIADAAVDAYRAVTASLGLLFDAGELAVAVVDGAVDVVGDAAGAIGDILGGVFGD